MIIQRLQLHSRDLAGQYALFATQLGLPVLEKTSQRLALQCGHSTLIFEQQSANHVPYHYALQIPSSQFEEASTWLAARRPLLHNSAGQQHYHFEGWNAHGLYFADADGNIAELIAHHDLVTPTQAPFSFQSVLGISEIGLVTSDVVASVTHLQAQYGLQPYRGAIHAEFTAMGDIHGVFIVVMEQRPWLPTGQPAEIAWFAATCELDGRIVQVDSHDLVRAKAI